MNQTSPVQGSPGSLTETFDGLALGNLPAKNGSLAIGTYAETTALISNDYRWGGAAATGQYASGGSLLLDIQPSKYVGFWWSAINGPNEVSFYDASSRLLGSFDASSIYALVGTPASPNPVVAFDGLTYSGAAYYGNPNFSPKTNDMEPYIYVNFGLSDPSLSFSKVHFNGSGFEFDNLTISPNHPVPGPLPLVGCAAAFGWGRRLRRRLARGR